MNPEPDYSAAYCILETDTAGLTGHGLTFTIGRGNELCCAAIEALAPLVDGLELDWIREDPARFWRRITGDSQLRWIGPDKGVMHLATARRRQRGLGSAGQGGRQAGVAPGRRDEPGADRRGSSTSATSPTASRRKKRCDLLAARSPARRAGSPSSRRTAIPATRHRPAGSAIRTTSSTRFAARPSIRVSTISSSRSAARSRPISAGCRSPAKRSGPTAR